MQALPFRLLIPRFSPASIFSLAPLPRSRATSTIFSFPCCIHALFRLHLYRGVLFFLCAYAYTLMIYPPIFPTAPTTVGKAAFSIRSVKVGSTAFGKNHQYEGTLTTFTAEDGTNTATSLAAS